MAQFMLFTPRTWRGYSQIQVHVGTSASPITALKEDVMKNMAVYVAACCLCALASAPAFANPSNGFVNGGFEDGDWTGWTVSNGVYRAGISNTSLTPQWVFDNDSPNNGMHSQIITKSYTDPNVGSSLGSTVYSGNYAARIEDTTSGGYASAIRQTVTDYTEANIFFAWKAVLEGAHGPDEAATMTLVLHDDTTNKDLIVRTYNAADGGSGVDPRFAFDGDNFYTPDWQIEQLALDPTTLGHTFTLSLLAADCQPTGHYGYVYLDGFGSVAPPPTTGVPEPSSLGLLGLGTLLCGGVMWYRRRGVAG